MRPIGSIFPTTAPTSTASPTRLRTVQGEVEAAIAKTIGLEVMTSVAGRTDAGVHARQQVLSFLIEPKIDVDRLLRSLSGQLAPEIAPLALVRRCR